MSEQSQVTPEQIKTLRKRMRLNQTEFGAVLRVTQVYVSRLETGTNRLEDTSLRVLVLWLMSVFAVEGGETPHPSIPIVIAPTPSGKD